MMRACRVFVSRKRAQVEEAAGVRVERNNYLRYTRSDASGSINIGTSALAAGCGSSSSAVCSARVSGDETIRRASARNCACSLWKAGARERARATPLVDSLASRIPGSQKPGEPQGCWSMCSLISEVLQADEGGKGGREGERGAMNDEHYL